MLWHLHSLFLQLLSRAAQYLTLPTPGMEGRPVELKLTLVTMCHLVHWDRQTNCCLAVLTRPSSWRTRHFLVVRQRSGMTCLLTVVLQLLSIVLNAILNANSFTLRTLITSSNSCLSRLRFRFIASTYWRFTNWFCICICIFSVLS